MEIAANLAGFVALAVAYAAFAEAVKIRENTKKLLDRLDRLDTLEDKVQNVYGEVSHTSNAVDVERLDSKARHDELLKRLSVSTSGT